MNPNHKQKGSFIHNTRRQTDPWSTSHLVTQDWVVVADTWDFNPGGAGLAHKAEQFNDQGKIRMVSKSILAQLGLLKFANDGISQQN